MHASKLISAAAATSLLSLFAPVAATGQGAAGDRWRFSIGAYVWMSGIEGDRTVSPGATPVTFGGHGLFGGRVTPGIHIAVGNGRWSLLMDAYSVEIEDELKRVGEETAGSGVTSQLELQSAEILVGQRFGSWASSTGLELLGGVRYTSLYEEFGDGGKRSTFAHRWLDPTVMARLVSRPAQGVGFLASWQVGGFGLGSELSWGMETDLIFRWSDHVDLLVGYLLSDVDYQSDIGAPNAFVYNGTIRGLRTRLNLNF